MLKSLKQFLLSAAVALAAVASLSPAMAQANLDVDTPAIGAIRKSMAERAEKIVPHFASGAIGLTKDGLVAMQDANVVPLPQRAAVNALVADDNKDRNALYKEIARANGKPEWEGDIRATFAQTWIKKAPAGWFYQDASGAWKKKA
jgi:uncharacterized protein